MAMQRARPCGNRRLAGKRKAGRGSGSEGIESKQVGGRGWWSPCHLWQGQRDGEAVERHGSEEFGLVGLAQAPGTACPVRLSGAQEGYTGGTFCFHFYAFILMYIRKIFASIASLSFCRS